MQLVAVRVAGPGQRGEDVVPAVSAGVYGWPMDDAARIAVETVRSTDTAVEEVRFVLFDERAYEAFASQVG